MALSGIWPLVLPALGAVAWLLWCCRGDFAGRSNKATIRASRAVQLAVVNEPGQRRRARATCSRSARPK
jgi:hypothetical protein